MNNGSLNRVDDPVKSSFDHQWENFDNGEVYSEYR